MSRLWSRYACLGGHAVRLFSDFTTSYARNSAQYFNFDRLNGVSKALHSPKCRALTPFVFAFSLFTTKVDDQANSDAKQDNKDIQELVIQGKSYLAAKQNPGKAEMSYLKALHLALERGDRKVIAHVQDLLANLALHANQYDKAEPLFRSVLQNLIATGTQPNDPAILEISLKLASIYAGQSKKELAVTGYNWCADTCRSNLKKFRDTGMKITDKEYLNSAALLGMILDSYGRYLFDTGQHKEALACAMEAKQLSQQIYGENDVRTLVLYNDIGSVKSRMGQHEEALEYVLKAVNGAESSAVEANDKAVFYTNLSMVYMQQGKHKEAEEAYKKALIEVSKTKDEQLKRYVGSLANILVLNESEKKSKS
uniref:Uncharacterized protein n=1 Tax=Ciona savignyi TaxID=51511 RepID=H2Z3L7_CIOSA